MVMRGRVLLLAEVAGAGWHLWGLSGVGHRLERAHGF